MESANSEQLRRSLRVIGFAAMALFWFIFRLKHGRQTPPWLGLFPLVSAAAAVWQLRQVRALGEDRRRVTILLVGFALFVAVAGVLAVTALRR